MEKKPKFYKAPVPLDSLLTHPWIALTEAWGNEHPKEFIFGEIQNWFYMALASRNGAYAAASIEERETFVEFFADLLELLEIAYCCRVRDIFFDRNQRMPDQKQIQKTGGDYFGYDYTFAYLKWEDQVQPMIVIRWFCGKYPIAYARRELYDLYRSAYAYEGPLRDRVSVDSFPENYQRLSIILEASYGLTFKVGREYVGL